MPRGRPAGRHPRTRRTEEEGDAMYHGVKLGEHHRTDIQVAINEGNTREDAFFMIRVGKASSAMPFQQPIPIDFARYHQTLYMQDVTIEGPCGRVWRVGIRRQSLVMRFGKGWKQFAVDNHLREGLRLLFTLTCKSRFLVQFFDDLGKSHVAFPALTAGTASHSHSQSVMSDREHCPSPDATPLAPLLRNVTEPAAPATFDCNLQGKSIPRPGVPHLQPEVLVLQASADKSAALEDDTFNAWNGLPAVNGLEQAQQETQADEEGKSYYIHLDTDDDDDLICLPAGMRDASEEIKFDSEFFKAEQAEPPSSEQEEVCHHIGEDNGHNIPSRYLEGQRGPVTRTTVKKRPPRQGTAVASSPSSSPPVAASWGGYRHEVADTSGIRNAMGEGFLRGGSRAMQLLEQQGCMKFSEIVVPKCNRVHVSDQERTRVVNAAERFAIALVNAKFLVVMRDAQVYHEFQLEIPGAILEAAGTMRATKVKVFLTDREKRIYVTSWEWHDSCDSTRLSSDGWARFALDHAMEDGDVCVFELVDSGPAFHGRFLFSVHIFRVAADAAVLHHRSDIPAGGPTSHRKSTLGVKSSEGGLKHDDERRKRPVTDLHRLRLRRTLLKPRNLQPWTKLIKRRTQGRCALRQV